MVRLDFPQAEIADVAKAISELTKKNFILDERVRGKVTIISPTPVTEAEAYQAFISALEVKGFTVIRTGKIHKIIQLRNMKSEPVPTDVKYTPGGSDIFVTRLVPIEFIKAAELSKSLRGLISKNGDLISYDPTNTLIITDTVGNLRRVMKIINRLDQKGFEESLDVIALKYASATEMADKLRTIFNVKDKKGKVAGKKVAAAEEGGHEFISKIIPDERTNTLIVLANQQGLKRVRDVVRKIDQALQDEINTGRIHVHYLQYADATEMAGTLSSLTGGSRGAGRSTRPRANQRKRGNSTFTRASGSNQPTSAPAAPGGSGGSAINIFGGEVFITADPPTNALVITAAPADYEALLPVINRLDIRRPQAFIEAMVARSRHRQGF